MLVCEELQTDKYNNDFTASNSMQTKTNGDTCLVAFEPIDPCWLIPSAFHRMFRWDITHMELSKVI